jgi:16S rRNA (guanine1207-N2)-methyltransferase
MTGAYWAWRTLEGRALTKPGIPGYPHLEPAQMLLLEALENVQGTGRAVDLSARGGAVALRLRDLGWSVGATDDSAASVLALRELGLEDDGGNANLVCAMLEGERGNARVAAQLHTAWTRLSSGGALYLAGDKDKGFERYLKGAVQAFGAGEVVARGKGFRVARLEKRTLEPPPAPEAQHFTIQARGLEVACVALPGVFAAGKLDAASALLLEHIPDCSGLSVLDLGAGYGALGATLALEGARVAMLENDAPSAQSCLGTLHANGLEARVLHSDVDAALEPDAKFQRIVTNPPFHVGRDLKLEVAGEFIHAAARRLLPGGDLWLVANHFLPYEALMAEVGRVETVAQARGFKVLHAQRKP